VTKPKAAYRQILPLFGDAIHEVRSTVLTIANHDKFTLKPGYRIEEWCDAVFLIIGRDNKAVSCLRWSGHDEVYGTGRRLSFNIPCKEVLIHLTVPAHSF
jgi:hypothetical protein